MKNNKLEYWLEDEKTKNLEYWMALNDYEIEEGKLDIRQLLDKGLDIKDFFENDYITLKKEFGNKADYIWRALKKIGSKVNIEAYKENKIDLLQKGVRIIKYTDRLYSKSLKNSERLSPLVLYQKGTLLELQNCVAIIGARDSSHYGRQKARELSQYLAEKGYIIVAGLALGIDTEAHCGALDVNGTTVAVIPNIKEITPQSNRRLAEDIMKHGALLSSGSPFSKLSKDKWVKRNKIISGISRCLIAIESPESKGTYHQVNFALKQGIKVFVLEPRERDKLACSGFKRFLKMGATPFTVESEILDYLENPIKVPPNQVLNDFVPY